VTAARAISDMKSPLLHANAVRAQLSLLYLYRSAGGQISSNVANEVLITITQFMRLEGVASLETKQKKKLMGLVMDIIRYVLSTFARLGAKPGISVFNSIITNLGGFGHSRSVIGTALADAQALGIEPNQVTRRSILTAAGMLKDEDLIQSAWNDLVEAHARKGSQFDGADWYCLTKAAHAGGCIDFAHKQFAELSEMVPDELRSRIQSGLDENTTYDLPITGGHEIIFDMDVAETELKKIDADLQTFEAAIRDNVNILDPQGQKLPMTLQRPTKHELISDKQCRELYNELTTERPVENDTRSVQVPGTLASPLLPPSMEAKPPAKTQTNIPFGELRFENWKSLNWLLERSESNDRVYHQQVDEAIAAGVAPPQRNKGWVAGLAEQSSSYGLSDAVSESKDSGKKQSVKQAEVDAWRDRILKLRGRSV